MENLTRFNAAMHFVNMSSPNIVKFMEDLEQISLSNRERLEQLVGHCFADNNFKKNKTLEIVSKLTDEEIALIMVREAVFTTAEDYVENYVNAVRERIDLTNQKQLVALESIVTASNMSDAQKVVKIVNDFLRDTAVHKLLPDFMSALKDASVFEKMVPYDIDFSEYNEMYKNDVQSELTTLDVVNEFHNAFESTIDFTRQITGKVEEVSTAVATLFNMNSLPPLYLTVISKLYSVSLDEARDLLVEAIKIHVPDYEINKGVEESVIDVAYNDCIWAHSGEMYGDVGDGTTYYEYFIGLGFNDTDAISEVVNHIKKVIMAEINDISNAIEYHIEGSSENDVEMVGGCLVPKRRVKYDYAVDLKMPVLQLTAGDFVVPSRAYAPFRKFRCQEMLDNLRDLLLGTTPKSKMDLQRLQMEIAFYEFKLSEVNTIELPAIIKGIPLNFGIEWKNGLISDEDYDKYSRIYQTTPVQKDNQDVVNGVYETNRKYLDFKLKERNYNNYILSLKDKE